MCAVAVGFVGTVFASAPGDRFFLKELNDNRGKTTSFMRPIAKRLVLGPPAGTPSVFARLHFPHIWGFLCNDWPVHIYLLKFISPILKNLIDCIMRDDSCQIKWL